jgi:hypothetical protein
MEEKHKEAGSATVLTTLAPGNVEDTSRTLMIVLFGNEVTYQSLKTSLHD